MKISDLIGWRTRPADKTVRAFWHGNPLTSYQTMCLRSFVDRGCAVEVFCYDRHLAMPAGVVRRDAADVWPTDEVMIYQSGFGTGSPSLHSNLFRYAMLHRLGGWWIDLDVVLLGALPVDAMYFARERPDLIAVGTLRFPARHALLAEAVEICVGKGKAALWGQTGPQLFTALLARHGLEPLAKGPETTYPVPWREIAMLFDPARYREAEDACRHASFLHLYGEVWRQSKIPVDLRPPEGSFLDMLAGRHKVDFGTDRRMDREAIIKGLAWTQAM